MLSIEDVTKEHRRGSKVVVANDGITLHVAAGEVFGMLGPNGAGKTTLVRQIVGLTVPTAGRIRIGDVDVVADPSAARARCSWQPQDQAPIRALNPMQALRLVGEIRGASRRDAKARATRLIDALDMGEWAGTPGTVLSGGVSRLVAFAMAATVPGDVVILDE